jgi:adenine-specific DNA-methyltransferase
MPKTSKGIYNMVELSWKGKYDKNGKQVAPIRTPLPFQTVETVNESAQQRQKTLDLFRERQNTEWRNRLIWGDKKYVLPSLLPDFAGKIDLIYIDPPFATGADFTLNVKVGDKQFQKEPTIIEQKAYRDTWGKGLDSYLQWFYETSVLLFDLLSPKGSLYVHLDWHVSHYAKLVLDEVFGEGSFRNEIVWSYRKLAKAGSQFPKSHDVILFYTRGRQNIFNTQYVPLAESTLKRWGDRKRGGKDFNTRFATDEPSDGAVMPDTWDIPLPIGANPQKTGYPTQKPEELLERIIKSSSNEDSIVLDCFCGSGTTAAVAEKLGRRWIACDLGRFAIHITRKRLLSIEGVRPFVVQNLGKYERQIWQKAQFGDTAAADIREYRDFILSLYNAEPIPGYTWIHGKKGGRMVHVGTVDSPVAAGDVRSMAIEFRKLIGKGKNSPKEAAIDILGWDFGFELNEIQKQIANEAQINVRFVRIPREILDERGVNPQDIIFFELGALSAEVKIKPRNREATIELTDFMIPDAVPNDVVKAIKHWSEWIDYWAVDFNYSDDTFHNEWQTYRTRQSARLDLKTSYQYSEGGKYTILVKVIDILGNDTTKSFEIELA